MIPDLYLKKRQLYRKTQNSTYARSPPTRQEVLSTDSLRGHRSPAMFTPSHSQSPSPHQLMSPGPTLRQAPAFGQTTPVMVAPSLNSDLISIMQTSKKHRRAANQTKLSSTPLHDRRTIYAGQAKGGQPP